MEYIKGKSNVLSDALSRIKITSESLKRMYVLTRSMTRAKPSKMPDPPTQEPDQLHVYEAVSSLESFDLPKLTFNYNYNSLSLDMIIYNKKFKKRLTTAVSLAINSNLIENIQKALQNIDSRPAQTNKQNKQLQKDYEHAKKQNKIALQSNDDIFKYIDINTFKK